MIDLFIEGGMGWISLLTIELIALFFAAWKAPTWVREIGAIALSTGILSTFIGLFNAFGAIEMAGDISMSLLCGGLRLAIIPICYGILIFIASLVIRIVQKPRM